MTRRRWIGILLLGVAVLGVAAGVMVMRARSLQARLPRVAIGMTGTEAEQILGSPVMVLPRSNGLGVSMVWVDQLWQVDVTTGPGDRIEKVSCKPSDSATRRVFGWLFQ